MDIQILLGHGFGLISSKTPEVIVIEAIQQSDINLKHLTIFRKVTTRVARILVFWMRFRVLSHFDIK